MVNYLIMCRSLTYAQKIAKTLERAGINAWIIRSPASITPTGCSHSVKIAERNLARALQVINHMKLPYMGIYVGTVGEGYREVAP